MRYNPLLELSAFLFLSVIAVHFFTRQRYPNRANRVYAAFIILGLVDLAADIASVFVIENSASISMFWNWSVNMLLYFCQITLTPLMLIYTLCLTKTYIAKYRVPILLSMIPYAITVVLLALNPWTDMFFYFDAAQTYLHGKYFLLLYGESLLYLFASLIYAVIHRKRLRLVEYGSLITFSAIIAVSVVLQALFPQYLMTGVAMALSVTMMYLTLQNPNDMLDSATGAFNRDACILFLGNAVSASAHFQIVRLNISGIDRIGNALGVLAGDSAMGQIGLFLRFNCMGSHLFRIRDDSFVIIFKGERACRRIIKRVTERFSSPWRINDLSLYLGVRVTYISDCAQCQSLEELLSLFNSVSFKPDASDDGKVVEIDRARLSRVRRATEVERLLRRSLEEGRVELVLQPLYHIPDHRISSAEVLSRLRGEDGMPVMPGEFVPIAERTGLVVKLGQQVIEKSCAFLAESGLKNDPDFQGLCINLSVVECLDETLVPKIRTTTSRYGVPPDKLCFEITETTATLSTGLAEKMALLNSLGYQFSLDDFGTGYANYDSFMRLPFAAVKFDRQMLVMCAESKKNETLFFRTIDMTVALGYHVVVEGVETQEQATLLAEHGVEYAQGYFYGYPQPAGEFLTLYSGQSPLPVSDGEPTIRILESAFQN